MASSSEDSEDDAQDRFDDILGDLANQRFEGLRNYCVRYCRRLADWEHELKTKMPAILDAVGGRPPLPEELPPEIVALLSKILVALLVGRTYGEDRYRERVRYQENLVRSADLHKLHEFHPFFATIDVEDGDLYVWSCAAHAYADYLFSQPDFRQTTESVALDIYAIQHVPQRPTKKAVARPAASARTNKKKARRGEVAPPRFERVAPPPTPSAPAMRAYTRIRWQSIIRRQIKLNRTHRMQTAKNIIERKRREQVRRMAEAAKTTCTEAPFSTKGPSGPSPKQVSTHIEMPTVADRAKRECQKADSIEKSKQHHLQLEEKESLRVAQIEKKLAALRVASQIQNGE